MVKNNEKLIHWFNDFKNGLKQKKINSAEIQKINRKWQVSSNLLTGLVNSKIITRVKLGHYEINEELTESNIKKVRSEMSKIVRKYVSKKRKKQKYQKTKKPLKKCAYCYDYFEMHHRLQKYCPEKFGKKDYCKLGQKSLLKSTSDNQKNSLIKRLVNWFKSIF